MSSNNALYAYKSPFNASPLPLPPAPPETLKYPPNLASLNVEELVALYTTLTHFVSYTGLSCARLEGMYHAKQQEVDRETTLRFVHSEYSSTTERKERAKASRKVIGLSSEASLMYQDLVVVRALLEGYRTQMFSVRHEIERRRHE
jgi:hypothetical protein